LEIPYRATLFSGRDRAVYAHIRSNTFSPPLLQRHDLVCLLARDMARISDVQVEFRERVSTSSASIKRETD
jgi:hypothetical protein